MSSTITENFVTQWGETVTHLAQQTVSRLRTSVLTKTGIRGKQFEQSQLDATDMEKRTVRNADTPLLNVAHKRRFGTLVPYDWADLIDNVDDVSTLIDPVNAYTQTAAAAMGRTIDRVIINALKDPAKSGESGSTSVQFDTTNQQIALSNSGLTLNKLLSAAHKLRQNEAYGPMNEWHIALTSKQLDDLLSVEQVTSADYTAVKALVNGEINSFMGFHFHHTELLPKSGTTRSCYAWAKSGVCLGIGKEVKTEISVRPDKNFATQVYACIFLGAVRLEEKKVVEIQCKE